MDDLERHKQQVRRFYDEIWNRADLTAMPDVLTTDVVFRGSLGVELTGHAEFASYVREVTSALADYRCDIEGLVAEAEQVVARMTFSGLHRGPLLGFPATGRRVSWTGVAFFTFSEGRIADLWVLGDLHGLAEQLTG